MRVADVRRGKELPAVDVVQDLEAQEVTEAGVSVSLSDGTLVALVGVTVLLAADRIAVVRAADAQKAEMDASAA